MRNKAYAIYLIVIAETFLLYSCRSTSYISPVAATETKAPVSTSTRTPALPTISLKHTPDVRTAEVKSFQLNVFSCPSMKDCVRNILHTFSEGDHVEVVGVSEDYKYFQVTYEDGSGWVPSSGLIVPEDIVAILPVSWSKPTETPTLTISPLVDKLLKPGQVVEHPPTDENPYTFFSYFPSSAVSKHHIIIGVWPHQGGSSSNNYSYHEGNAQSTIQWLTEYSDKYQIPFVVVAIPRIQDLYVNALFPETFTTSDPMYSRPDLKLIDAVWNQYIPTIKEAGFQVEDRVFMMGFSSPGVFTLRFTMLHPNLIKAAWMGAPSFAPLPTGELNGLPLNYPLGIKNIEVLTGEPFDQETYKKIPHFIVIGERDNNPNNVTLPWYSQTAFIRNNIGETEPERVEFFYEYLVSMGLPAVFHMYQGVGHQLTDEMMTDAFEFLVTQPQDVDVTLSITATP